MMIFLQLESYNQLFNINNMKVFCVFALVLCVWIAQCKTTKKQITMRQFSTNMPIFMTRFDFGIGEGNITLKHKKLNVDNTQFTQIKIGLLLDQNYDQFKSANTCQEKQSLFRQIQRIRFFDASHGTQIIRVEQNVRQHLWFIYMYTCQPVKFATQDGSQKIRFQTIMINNGSHFGQDQSLMWPYILLMGIWGLIIVRYLFMPFLRSFGSNKITNVEMALYVGYALQGLGTFYKIINLVTVYSSGQSLVAFDILHACIKICAQAILLSVIIAVSQGWTLTHLSYQKKIVGATTIVAILNIICVVLWHLSEEIQDSYHQYSQPSGIVVFLIRILISVIFIFGCLSISAQSVSKRKYFIAKFTKYGIIYLLAWPTAVVICQLFVAKYLHNQIITITEQYVHLITNAYICRLFVNPESQYQKVTIKQKDDQDSILPQYKR